MLGVAPFDWQLNDSYFVIAHFHYVIVGGILVAFLPSSITGTQALVACSTKRSGFGISGSLRSAFI